MLRALDWGVRTLEHGVRVLEDIAEKVDDRRWNRVVDRRSRWLGRSGRRNL